MAYVGGGGRRMADVAELARHRGRSRHLVFHLRGGGAEECSAAGVQGPFAWKKSTRPGW